MSNENLSNSKIKKNDEFYTKLEDIEKELEHYKDHFKGKIVYCNCDDYKSSNFVKYFETNGKALGLKKLIISGFSLSDNTVNIDFRSEISIEFLEQADIVVTNPPFSLFIEHLNQLEQFNKKYLIIGNMNAISVKNVFKLIYEKKLWLGVTNPKSFILPDNSISKACSTRWFTNLKHNKIPEPLVLTKTYNKEEYPEYDNYNAINVNKVKDIPKDYFEAMGVPITFLDKHNLDQFEILGLSNGTNNYSLKPTKRYENSKQIDINNISKNSSTVNTHANLLLKNKPINKTYYIADNIEGYLISLYGRIFIKRRIKNDKKNNN